MLAKAALLAGPAVGVAVLAAEGVDGVLVTDAGEVCVTPGFAGWCTAAPDRVTSGAGTRSS